MVKRWGHQPFSKQLCTSCSEMGGGGKDHPLGSDLHTILCTLTQGPRVYMQCVNLTFLYH